MAIVAKISVTGEVSLVEEDIPFEALPVVVPQQISKAQGLLALIHFGMYQNLVDYINGIQDPTQKLIAEVNVFQRNTWERSNELLVTLATSGLSITEEQVDDMFIFGATQ